MRFLWPSVVRNHLVQRDKMDVRPQPLLAGAAAPSPLNCLFCFFLICSLSLQTRRHFRSPTSSLNTMFSKKTRSTAFQAGFFEELLRSCTSRSGSADTRGGCTGVWSWTWPHQPQNRHFQVLSPALSCGKATGWVRDVTLYCSVPPAWIKVGWAETWQW